MELEILVVGDYQVNCSLYWNPESKEGVIIDPGAEGQKIVSAVDKIGFRPLAVLLTHGHSDHIGGVREVIKRYETPLYASKHEEQLLGDSTANMSAFLGLDITTPPADVWLDDEQVVQIGPVSFRVLHTPGHSPGGVCYLDEKANLLFCGDILFYGSIGRTDFPGCSTELLLSSIREKLLPLPDSIRCIPGHGPTTTIGGERVNNPFLQGSDFV